MTTTVTLSRGRHGRLIGGWENESSAKDWNVAFLPTVWVPNLGSVPSRYLSSRSGLPELERSGSYKLPDCSIALLRGSSSLIKPKRCRLWRKALSAQERYETLSFGGSSPGPGIRSSYRQPLFMQWKTLDRRRRVIVNRATSVTCGDAVASRL